MSEILERVREALKDRYEVEREIGRGGMAIVFLARDLRLPRHVAIKVLRPEFVRSDTARRFLREIHIEAGLQHPNIVTLFDSGQADGLPYFVMEYVEGESLRDRLVREGQFSLETTLAIARQVGEGLAYAHNREVVHRDIKPENILLSGERGLIADFGIARAAAEAGVESITPTDIVLGTPQYMSPEQCGADPTIDHRTDIYSLACVVYEMLAGEPPFTGRTRSAIVAKQLNERVPSLKVVRQNVPVRVVEVIEKALEKVPADRYGEVADFYKALEQGLESDVSSAPVLQRKGSWLVGTILLVAVLVASTLITLRVIPSGEMRLDPARVAVLYFEDLSETGDLAHIARGLTEDLVDELSAIHALNIVSSTGIKQLRASALAPDSVGRIFQTGSIVSGSVDTVSGRVRVTVRVIDGESGRQLDSKSVTKAWTDSEFFALQEQIIEEVAVFLRRRLGSEIRRERMKRAGNLTAWELVQRAEVYIEDAQMMIRDGNVQAAIREYSRSDTLLSDAETEAPTWTEPILMRGWLARSQAILALWNQMAAGAAVDPLDSASRASLTPLQWLAIGLGHADRALKLSGDQPRALELRGALRYYAWQMGDTTSSLLADAEHDLNSALREEANLARALWTLSGVYQAQGEFPRADRVAQRALEADAYLDEARNVINELFFASLPLGHYEQSAYWCEAGQTRFPKDYRFFECQLTLLGWAGFSQDDVEEAWTELATIEARDTLGLLADSWVHRRMMVAAVLARAGLSDSASSVISGTRNEASSEQVARMDYPEAKVWVLLGDFDRAIDMIESYLEKSPLGRHRVLTDPWFAPLRNSIRFNELMADTVPVAEPDSR